MSSYPAGVTGREPQIAGPIGELTRTVECSATTYDPASNTRHMETDGIGLPTTWLETLQLAIAEAQDPTIDPNGTRMPGWRLRAVKRDLDAILATGNTDEVECPWDGPVDFTAWNREEAGADCPICDRELTIDLTD